jgi:hypothetical protein
MGQYMQGRLLSRDLIVSHLNVHIQSRRDNILSKVTCSATLKNGVIRCVGIARQVASDSRLRSKNPGAKDYRLLII